MGIFKNASLEEEAKAIDKSSSRKLCKDGDHWYELKILKKVYFQPYTGESAWHPGAGQPYNLGLCASDLSLKRH